MTTTNFIPRPFPSGRCTKCHSDEYIKSVTLCPTCSVIVGQDFRSQKLRLVSPRELRKSSDEFALHLASLPEEFEERAGADRRLRRIFEKAGLTQRQRQVLRRFFGQGETFSKISASLGISKTSIANHMRRAAKKLKKCRKPAIFMSGSDFFEPVEAASEKAELFRPRMRRLKSFNLENLKERRKQNRLQSSTLSKRIIFGKICPRCKDRVFKADRNYLYCMNCFWNSDQES